MKSVGIATGLLAAASFAIAVVGSRHWPSANFYLPVSRVWELLAGTGVALWLLAPPVGLSVRVRDGLAVFGLILVLVPIWTLDDTTPFPGWAAVLPVGGTVLLLLFAQGATGVGSILAGRGMVTVGLISYSLYLWHQPVFVFARIWLGEDPTPGQYAGLVLVSIGLAALTRVLVENPFRQSAWIGRKTLVAAILGPAVALGALAAVGHLTNGLPARFEPGLARQLAEARYDRACLWQDGKYPEGLASPECTFGHGPRVVVLIGDSVAASIAPSLVAGLDPEAVTFYQFTHGHCLPLDGVLRSHKGGAQCAAFLATAATQARQLNADRVILAGAWFSIGTPEQSGVIDAATGAPIAGAAFATQIESSLARYVASLPEEVLAIAPYAATSRDVSDMVLVQSRRSEATVVDLRISEAGFADPRDWIISALGRAGAQTIVPLESYCDGETCALVVGSRLLLADRFHYTPFAAQRIARAIMPLL